MADFGKSGHILQDYAALDTLLYTLLTLGSNDTVYPDCLFQVNAMCKVEQYITMQKATNAQNNTVLKWTEISVMTGICNTNCCVALYCLLMLCYVMLCWISLLEEELLLWMQVANNPH